MEPLNWYRILIWFLGCLLFAGLSIMDILPLINEFTTNNIDVRMNVTSSGLAPTPPNLSLYLPRADFGSLRKISDELRKYRRTGSFNCVECEKLSNRTWDVWSSLKFTENRSANDDYMTLSASMSKKLLIDGSADDFAVLDVSNLNWNLPILDAAWDLMECIATMDTNIDYGTVWDRKICIGMHDLDFGISTGKMEKLFDRIIDIMCAFMEFQGSPWRTCRQTFENSMGAIGIDGYGLEIPILPNGSWVEFKPMSKNGVIWPAMTENAYRSYSLYVNEGLATLVWPLPGSADVVLFASNPSFSAGTSARLSYSSIFKVSDKRKITSCYNETSVVVCKSNCMLSKIVRMCNCIPFTFRQHKPSRNQRLPFCNTTLYSNCRLNDSEALLECKRKCIRPCEHTQYQWQITTRRRKNLKTNSIALSIKPRLALVPLVEFSTHEKYTFEQLFAQMASVVNLYLGISGLELIGWSVLIIEYLLARYKKKNEYNMNGDQKESMNQQLRAVVSEMKTLKQTMQRMAEEMKNMNQKLENFTKLECELRHDQHSRT